MTDYFLFTPPPGVSFDVESTAPRDAANGPAREGHMTLSWGDRRSETSNRSEMVVSMSFEEAARLHALLGAKLEAVRAGVYDKEDKDMVSFLEEWLQQERQFRAEWSGES